MAVVVTVAAAVASTVAPEVFMEAVLVGSTAEVATAAVVSAVVDTTVAIAVVDEKARTEAAAPTEACAEIHHGDAILTQPGTGPPRVEAIVTPRRAGTHSADQETVVAWQHPMQRLPTVAGIPLVALEVQVDRRRPRPRDLAQTLRLTALPA